MIRFDTYDLQFNCVSMNYFDQLPDEVIFHFTSFMDTESLSNFSKVCGSFYQICYDILYKEKIEYYMDRLESEKIYFVNMKTLIPKNRKITYICIKRIKTKKYRGKSFTNNRFTQIDFIKFGKRTCYEDAWIFGKKKPEYDSIEDCFCSGIYRERGSNIKSNEDVKKLLDTLFEKDYLERTYEDILDFRF